MTELSSYPGLTPKPTKSERIADLENAVGQLRASVTSLRTAITRLEELAHAPCAGPHYIYQPYTAPGTYHWPNTNSPWTCKM